MKKLKLLGILILFTQCELTVPSTVGVEMEKLPEKIDYNYHVKPLLSDRCYQCHGPDEKTRKAGLRLDIEKNAFSKLTSGNKAFSKGSLYKSESIHRILSDNDEVRMPPPESNLNLSEREKAILIKWIEQGAEWKEHWSFIAPQKNRQIPKGETPFIDHFIAKKHQEKNLSFSPPASKETLLRRVYFDLTGLPPTVEQIDAFLNDSDENAYEKVVDTLLQSTAYAERMATNWMDLSRYADSHGLHADGLRTMWPWRDWVIKAFDQNMPYDQFVTWQLAGDLLPNATREQKLATAFNRNSPMTAEGGVIDEEWRLNYVFDRTETMSTAFLGLTVACAKCHDHKFDPISQKDYYQLTAFFNNIRELGMTGDDGDYGPLLPLPDENTEATLKRLEKSLSQIETEIELSKKQIETLNTYIDELPTPEHILKKNIGYYPFDKVDANPKKTKNTHPFITDQNKNVGSTLAPRVVAGIKNQALSFEQDYDRLYISKEIPNFEWIDSFSAGVWINTDQQDPDFRQFIIGTTGGKNNWWRGWDFYLDGNNNLNFRLINIAPGNMVHVKTDLSIPIEQWTHVAFSYNGSGEANGIKIYVNGKEAALQKVIDNLYKSILPVSASGLKIEDRPVLVGKSYEGSTGDNGTFSGMMDDLLFFDKKLTAFEMDLIFKSYQNEQAIPNTQLVAQHQIENHPKTKELEKKLKQTRREWLNTFDPVLEVMVMEELPKPRKTFLYNRGNYDDPAEEVTTAVPSKLPAMNQALPKNRLGLAKWLFDTKNPLTARVAVNRYWQMIFGRGLVETSTDFGVQGSLPSHPNLLDALAMDFMENNWNVKELIKKMVLTKTYRQTSTTSQELYEKDPNNIFLARSNRYRLSAEMIRDNALATSGLLVNQVGGESVKPYQPEGLWKEKSTFSLRLYDYKTTKGDSLYRRSLYTFIRRTSPPPSMIAFDATSREVCTIQRENTSTPLQALVLLNDIQFFEASRVLAERIQREAGDAIEDQINYGFRLATSRYPNPEEHSVLTELYNTQLSYYRKNPRAARSTINVGEKAFDTKLNPIKTAALTMVANTLLNHNETFVKY
jgi:hypothetical protein